MEKKLTLPAIILLLIFSLSAILLGCNTKGEKPLSINNRSSGLEPNNATIEPETQPEGFHTLVKGDSIIQRIFLDGKLHFESLLLESERVYNHLYPEISDSFLFEDKYYLKLSYPIPFSGTIKTAIPDSPDYVLTPLSEDIIQVVVYNALDLKVINFKFDYLPSEKDSLVRSAYPLKYVAFE